ncbi:MAG: tRNA pseudouridine(38-40) synthase TruA [bacterium]
MRNISRNFKLTLEYNGAAFHGWQVQKGKPSLQALLQKTLKGIVGEKVTLIASGRTDAGVHALAQVAHFKTHTKLRPDQIQNALNARLPEDVAVKSVEEVAEDFHAQRDALRKTYAYLILNDRVPSAFLEPYSWQVKKPLDWDAVHAALECVVGEHDFKSFQSVGTPVKSTVRKIHSAAIQELFGASVQRRDSKSLPFPSYPRLYAIVLEGNGFLKQMVRNIVGTIIHAGLGKISREEFKKILEAKDRRKSGPAAPAKGLFLIKVNYEEPEK